MGAAAGIRESDDWSPARRIRPSRRSPLVAAALLAGLPLSSSADVTSGSKDYPEVSIPNTRHEDFISSVNGHSYAIFVALPLRPPPPHGYRVLFVLDGNGYFGSATEAVRSNGNAPDVLVVGIGYPASPEFVAEVQKRRGPKAPPAGVSDDVAARQRERPYDLTLPMTLQQLQDQSDSKTPPYGPTEVGGLDDFLKMIEVDVKPRVAKMAPIDASNEVLFGHSLGGLAVLRALFTEPSAYRTFVAASPSIWWNNRAVLLSEQPFADAVRRGAASPRILVTVGAEEGEAPPQERRKEVIRIWRRANMVGNARALVRRLKQIKGAPGFEVANLAVFPDETHGASVWPAIGRLLTFAFR